MSRQCLNHIMVGKERVRCRLSNGHWCPCEYLKTPREQEAPEVRFW